jgi:cytidine deaminase
MSSLEQSDRELVETAVDVLERHYDPERHTTGVALRTGDGDVYTGISLKAATSAADVHAEPIAVGRAILSGASSFDTVVAVQFADPPSGQDADAPRPNRDATGTRVVSPCGACRELLARQAPDVSVIVPGDSGPTIESLADILPY